MKDLPCKTACPIHMCRPDEGEQQKHHLDALNGEVEELILESSHHTDAQPLEVQIHVQRLPTRDLLDPLEAKMHLHIGRPAQQ